MDHPFKFYTRVRVRFNETDLQGHVNFAQYYFYYDLATTEYLEAIGYPHTMMMADNADILFAESHCNYKSSAKWPEWLRVYARVAHLSRRSFRFEFEVRAEADGRLINTGHIVAVTTQKDTFAPHPMPAPMRQAILAYEGDSTSVA
jgi:acyl-CoA thioester hydrolase